MSILKRAAILILVGSQAWSQTPAPHLPAKALCVPLFRQATGYSCGAASLQAILRYWQVYTGQESQLYERLGTTPKDGTHPDKLVEVAKAFGLTVRAQERTTLDDLRKALAQGTTVILNLQAWREATTTAKPWKETWEEGHYVVLVGLDAHYLYAMDPSVSGAYAYLPLQEFQDRWHDFEDRTGTRREFHQLAIFIQGKQGLAHFPGTLVRMD
jgi:predicted double-glycine peptidase